MLNIILYLFLLTIVDASEVTPTGGLSESNRVIVTVETDREESGDLSIAKTEVNKLTDRIKILEKRFESIQEADKVVKRAKVSKKTENESSELKPVVEKLIGRIETLEKNLDSIQVNTQTEKADKEASLDKFASRLEAIEKIVEESSYEDINTLKSAIADIRKINDDQSVRINIFEKKYHQLFKPIEPLLSLIDEQKMGISKLVVRLDKQMQMIKSLSQAIGQPITQSITTAEELGVELDQIAKAEADFRISNFLNSKDHLKIGNKFYARGLKFEPFGTSVKLTGKILNASENDSQLANFKIYLYSKDGDLLWDQDFMLTGIERGEIESFSEILTGVKVKQIDKYAITFGSNKVDPAKLIALNPGSQEDTKIYRDEKEVESVKQESEHNDESAIDEPEETTETSKQILTDNAENEDSITVEEIKLEQTAALEENTLDEEQTITPEETYIDKGKEDTDIEKSKHKDIGGGFYVKDLTITPIESGVEVSGGLRNISEKHHYLSRFSVKLLDKKKKLIEKHDIAITGIEPRSTAEFRETIIGASSEEIDSIEIDFIDDQY